MTSSNGTSTISITCREHPINYANIGSPNDCPKLRYLIYHEH